VNMRPRRGEEPELNMTSLIDVVLLLLIFFMVSTRFIDESRLRVSLPEASVVPTEPAVRDTVEIEVTADGRYRVDGQLLPDDAPATLSAALARTGVGRDRPVTLRADGRASHQAVVTAMDVAGRQGFRQIDIATVNRDADGP